MLKNSKQKRTGESVVTSLSVSKDILHYVNKYHLSPTEVFRKGMGVSLCELGVARYDNPYNRERLKNAEDFLTELRKKSDFKELLVKVKDLLEELNRF